MSCPFCEIDRGKSRIIETSKHCFVIFSNPRLMPGHLLVIPKRHVEKLSDLTSKEKGEVFELLAKYQEKILNNIANGCDIKQNYRPFQKQSQVKVHHMHFHLQPRELFDVLYRKSQIFETELFTDLGEKEIDQVEALLNKKPI